MSARSAAALAFRLAGVAIWIGERDLASSLFGPSPPWTDPWASATPALLLALGAALFFGCERLAASTFPGGTHSGAAARARAERLGLAAAGAWLAVAELVELGRALELRLAFPMESILRPCAPHLLLIGIGALLFVGGDALGRAWRRARTYGLARADDPE